MPIPDQPSARTIANRGKRIVMNKAAVDALYAGIADGLIELGERIIADARDRAPEDPDAARKRGVPMMKDTGQVAVFGPVAGKTKLLHGRTDIAQMQNRPRGVKVPNDQVVMIASFTSPIAHLLELGTVNMDAHPFLTPALMANVGNAGAYVKGAMSRYAATAGVRAENSTRINAQRAAKKATP